MIATIAMCWLVLALVGMPTLYILYGFVMSAIRSRNAGQSPRVVLLIDGGIAFVGVLLDALLNLLVFPVLCLDLRPSYLFKSVDFRGRRIYVPELVTGRLTRYNLDLSEWSWRRTVASLGGAFLDGKDPSGDHIKGPSAPITWLN